MSAPTTPDPASTHPSASLSPETTSSSEAGWSPEASLSPEARSLQAALARLVADGTLTADQAHAVLVEALPSRPTEPGRPSWTALLSEIGGYVGGAFVVAAVAVFTGPNWDRISLGGRVAVFAVPALLLVVAAFLLARSTPGGWTFAEVSGTTARRRLVAVLLLVAAGLGGGVAAVLNDVVDDGLVFFGTALVLTAAGYVVCRGFVLHAAMALAAAMTSSSLVMEIIDTSSEASWETEQMWVGLVLLMVAVLWAALSLAGVLAEQALGLLAAGVIGFVAGEILANGAEGQEWMGYLVLAVLAAAGLLGYIRLHYVGLLAVGVVALATVVPQAVIDYTEGALGAAGALLVTGLSIVGASAAGLRLRKEVTEDAAASR
jgi:hypothetical protein